LYRTFRQSAFIQNVAFVKALLEEKKRIEEAIAYIDRKQSFYDDVLSGKTPYFSNLVRTED